MPGSAEADTILGNGRPALTGKDCGYNNLFCEAGSGGCVICGSGTDTACKEQTTCGLTGG